MCVCLATIMRKQSDAAAAAAIMRWYSILRSGDIQPLCLFVLMQRDDGTEGALASSACIRDHPSQDRAQLRFWKINRLHFMKARCRSAWAHAERRGEERRGFIRAVIVIVNENTLSFGDIALLAQTRAWRQHSCVVLRTQPFVLYSIAPLPAFPMHGNPLLITRRGRKGERRRGVQNCKPHSDSVRLKCHFIQSARLCLCGCYHCVSSNIEHVYVSAAGLFVSLSICVRGGGSNTWKPLL